MDDNKRNQIYLAALLHDIGKFYQRADKKFADKYNELSDYSKRMAEDICPINEQGRFGYQHVIWTNEFFEKFGKKIEQIPGFKDDLYSNSSIDNVVNFACNHHKPQTLLQSIITMGDWWSAGIDRQIIVNDEQKNIEWGKGRYKTIPLYSIFNEVKVNGKKKEGERSAFMLNLLSIKKDDIFSKEIKGTEDGVSEADYKKLWKQFEEEFDKLPTDSFDGFNESLLYLLKKYTWSIPSNTMDMANVSLFEHLKTTAAFADSLYTYSLEHEGDFSFDEQTKRLKLKAGKYPVLLVGGDISGIQKFIYNIANSKAAKSLKGRSFYLQLLVDSVIQRIVTQSDIDVTLGHVVYSSGGKFYMLLPNIEKVKNALKEIKYSVEEELWEKHKGKLSVNLDYTAFAFSTTERKVFIEGEGEEKDLGDLWRALAEKLNSQKNKKFETLLNTKFNDFFEVNNVGGEVVTCAVTGEELEKGNKVKLKDTELFVSKAVAEQTELGTVLKDADYLITHRDNEKHKYLSSRSSKKNNTEVVGVYKYLFDQEELTKDDADFRHISSADVSRVVKFNETNFLAATLKGNKVSYGFQFYGGNKQAVFNQYRDKTFEELAKNDNGEQTYLGVLRMDVDGLGNIFIKGLEEENKSFAAYATMSFLLDLFFSGHLNEIRESEKYRDYVNILYSGGDDVFAIGRWDKLIEFAEDIRKEFAEFIGRDDISISGGIAIVRNKYPIAKAAELSGEFEEQSKKYNDGEKNAITFLGETVSWNKEYIYVKDLKNEFKRLIADGMSKGLLHKLMEFGKIKKESEDLSYKWNTAYYLKRFAERHKRNNEIQYFLLDGRNGLQTKLFVNNRSYDLVALAARWAELELREIN